jgi:ATP-dependent DNA helicase DinG
VVTIADRPADAAGPPAETPPGPDPSEVTAALGRVVRELPGGGEARPGQVQMAEAVAGAIAGRRHLAVQAGTGTGKSLGYLVPALLSGRRVIVATATKALQDQLAGKDLPFLAEHLDEPFDHAVLKGRSNYLCVQRLAEVAGPDGGEQLGLDGVAARAPEAEIAGLRRWAGRTSTGDRADLDHEPSERAWSAVSVTSRECPGANRCPRGGECFAEQARARAAEADVVVVNLHLYGLDVSSGGVILPDHDVVVIDEAHQLEDTISATAGLEVGPGRFTDLSRKLRGVVADDQLAAGVDDAGRLVADALTAHHGQRLRGELPDDLAGALAVARGRVERGLAAAKAVPSDAPEDAKARSVRVQQAAGALLDDLAAASQATGTDVVWVEGPPTSPVLRVAPVDVAGLLADALWSKRTAILTSATLPGRLEPRLGLPTGGHDVLDAGSPFDYGAQALLYCAAHLPDPRAAGHREALHDELAGLIEAAGGRTLALFTSFRAMDDAADSLRDQLEVPILTQRDLPKPRLIERFTADEATCLFATMGFWQGVDVPGPSLSLVTLDRLPFPRPDEPLLQARRERAGADAFDVIDLPRAATLLAQGAGRLVRAATDRGVVAVLDSRLASARYRWEIVSALPPMRRTKDRAEVHAFLRALRDLPTPDPTPDP